MIRVTTVYPGAVATDLLRAVRVERGQPYDPDRAVGVHSAAALIAGVLDHPDDAYVTELSFARP